MTVADRAKEVMTFDERHVETLGIVAKIMENHGTVTHNSVFRRSSLSHGECMSVVRALDVWGYLDRAREMGGDGAEFVLTNKGWEKVAGGKPFWMN